MLYLKKRRSKSGLSVFSVSFFYHTAVLILLTRCCGGNSHTFAYCTEIGTFTVVIDVFLTELQRNVNHYSHILHIGDVEYSLSQI